MHSATGLIDISFLPVDAKVNGVYFMLVRRGRGWGESHCVKMLSYVNRVA